MTGAVIGSWHEWTAPGATDPTRLGAFAELARYCGCAPHDLEVDVVDGGDGGGRPVVRFRAAATDVDRVKALLATAWARTSSVRSVAPRVLYDAWDRDPGPRRPVDAFRFVGPGLPMAMPPAAALMRRLDDHFRSLALADGADEYAVPHLVSEAVVERARYASTFPQHVVSCSVVRPELDALDRFAARPWPERRAELAPAGLCLSPAACLSWFAFMEGRRLMGPNTATFLASCGRHEAGSVADARRPTSYRVREIVAIGDAGSVEAFRTRWLSKVETLAADLGLPCRVQAANDPFVTDEGTLRASYQGSVDVKHELVARDRDGGLAVCSVNLHHQAFGRGFGIELAGGEPVHSACVGFGIERWAHWILECCGEDPAGWPTLLDASADQ